MLMSCAASGVAVTKRAAKEAATAVRRTRRPQNDAIRSCLLVGPVGRPSPVRGSRRTPCLLSAWRRHGLALLQPGARRAAVQTGAPPVLRRARLHSRQAPALRAGPALSACAMPLRDAAPFRRGFDRLRWNRSAAPPARAAVRCEARVPRRAPRFAGRAAERAADCAAATVSLARQAAPPRQGRRRARSTPRVAGAEL